jgi:spermidine/putrescine transport system permease protein
MNRRRVPALNVYGAVFLLLLYAPIALILIYSFNSNVVNMMAWEGFTLDWYRSIFGLTTRLSESQIYVHSTEALLAAVRHSAIVAFCASAISTAIGTATALALARHDFRLKRAYQGLLVLPMVMPDIVLGIALLIFFVNAGVSLGIGTIIIGQCTFLTSYVFIVVTARLAGMDRTLEHASADLGANEWTTFRRVVFPQLLPGIIGGALLAFIISMDDLVITYFIAGVDVTTLPMFIFAMLRRGIKPEINAIAVMMLTFSFVVASLGLYLRSRQK